MSCGTTFVQSPCAAEMFIMACTYGCSVCPITHLHIYTLTTAVAKTNLGLHRLLWVLQPTVSTTLHVTSCFKPSTTLVHMQAGKLVLLGGLSRADARFAAALLLV